MQELESLEKASVCVTTVIKVQFPDRLVLQGAFSPLETLADVYAWVGSQLQQAAPGEGGSGSGPPPFFLFTAPPMTPHLLPTAAATAAAAAAAASASYYTSSASPPPAQDPCLLDRKFTPLQLLHCAWGASPSQRCPAPAEGTLSLLTPQARALSEGAGSGGGAGSAGGAPLAPLALPLHTPATGLAAVSEAELSAMAEALLSGNSEGGLGGMVAAAAAAAGVGGGGGGREGAAKEDRASKLLKLMQKK